MRFVHFAAILFLMILFTACSASRKVAESNRSPTAPKTPAGKNIGQAPIILSMDKPLDINADELINYTKQYLGYPYLYASSDPDKGFDCSGLLFHVFKHFNVKSPRSSYDYEFIGKEVSTSNAQKGDLILFTGSSGDKIGHIGLITETNPQIVFIHSSGSRSGGVILSTLSGYYKQHFVKINRILH